MLSNHPSVLGGNGGGVASTIIGGIGLFADGTAAAPSISFINQPTDGFYSVAGSDIGLTLGGVKQFDFFVSSGANIQGLGAAYINFASGGGMTLLAQGTNKNITLAPSGTGNTILTTGLLVGTAVNSGALLQVGTNTTTSAGGMVFGTDTFLYRSAASTLSLDGDIKIGAGNKYEFAGRTQIVSISDGTLRLTNNAGTDFSRLQFGGTTSSFPALRRSGTSVEAVLADASDYANFGAKTFTIYGNATISQGSGSPEGVLTAPIGSIYVNTSGGASTTLYIKTSGAGNTGWTAK